MSATIWILSDPHFGHENIIRYCGRPFASAAEMDEAIIARVNAVVRPQDKLYLLGDVALRRPHLATIARLHGHKRLIPGNHDIYGARAYLAAGFEEVHGYRVFDKMLLSHIPVHPASLGRFIGNVHGHTHEKAPFGPRYLNVSVERTNYAPITLEQARAQLQAQIDAAAQATVDAEDDPAFFTNVRRAWAVICGRS